MTCYFSSNEEIIFNREVLLFVLGLSSDCEMGYEEDGDDNEDYIVDAAVASSPHTDQTRNTRNRGIVKPADSSDDFSDELQVRNYS